MIFFWGTLPETNIFAPENRPGPIRKGSSSNHQFSGAMLVSGRVRVMIFVCQPLSFVGQKHEFRKIGGRFGG